MERTGAVRKLLLYKNVNGGTYLNGNGVATISVGNRGAVGGYSQDFSFL